MKFNQLTDVQRSELEGLSDKFSEVIEDLYFLNQSETIEESLRNLKKLMKKANKSYSKICKSLESCIKEGQE